jgi:hypothetical protein
VNCSSDSGRNSSIGREATIPKYEDVVGRGSEQYLLGRLSTIA